MRIKINQKENKMERYEKEKPSVFKKIVKKFENPAFVLELLLLTQVITMIVEFIQTKAVDKYEDLTFVMMICTYFIILTIQQSKGKVWMRLN
jgi:hypothetical protein